MNKEVIVDSIKKYGLITLTYLKDHFGTACLEALKASWKFFINTLWNSIKDEVHTQLKSTIQFVEFFFDSPSYDEKEKAVIDTLMKNIKLPLALRPFRGILKKALKGKLKKAVSKSLKKLNTLT